MDYTVCGILQARILEWAAFPASRGSFQHRDQTQVSLITGDSLPAEPPGKPKNTGVGNLSLLQWIFPTQELNWVSWIAGGFFTNWAIREAQLVSKDGANLGKIFEKTRESRELLNKSVET